MRSRARRLVLFAALIVAIAAAGFIGSFVHTELLRRSFERQFWSEARYPNAQLLGSWRANGRVVAQGGGHCDFAAQAVYGTSDEYEPVEAHYTARTLNVGGVSLAFDIQPVSDRALSAEPPRTNDPDVATRDVLVRTHTDVASAQSFRTVYVVQAVSWGHPAWLDWRCRL